jgi:YVTN family beta-propeller protein
VTAIAVGKGSELCVDGHDDGVWVSNNLDDSVSRLDPATNRIVATVEVGSRPADGTRGPDGLEWIPNQGDGTITRIDPATDKVVDTIRVKGTPFVARTAFGDVWVDDFRGTLERRLHVQP